MVISDTTETKKSMMDVKIASLNLCLGLKFKKQMVEQILLENTIDILCLQEVEVENGFDLDLLSLRGFDLEMENNEVKSEQESTLLKTLTTHEKLTLKVKIHTW